jgi:hypothetical protein
MAVLGLIGTAGGAIAGVVITQRRSDARDRAAWKRERERWAREDAARTLDLRREAYIEFYAANKECLRRGRRRKAIDPRNRSFDAELAVLGRAREGLHLRRPTRRDRCSSRQGPDRCRSGTGRQR